MEFSTAVKRSANRTNPCLHPRSDHPPKTLKENEQQRDRQSNQHRSSGEQREFGRVALIHHPEKPDS